jgi:hypothetical protein
LFSILVFFAVFFCFVFFIFFDDLLRAIPGRSRRIHSSHKMDHAILVRNLTIGEGPVTFQWPSAINQALSIGLYILFAFVYLLFEVIDCIVGCAVQARDQVARQCADRHFKQQWRTLAEIVLGTPTTTVVVVAGHGELDDGGCRGVVVVFDFTFLGRGGLL